MAAAPTVPAERGGRRSPHRPLRVLAISSTALTFALIGIGALVRATGSGDACPDWPTCFGRWVPRLEYHVLIEYAHRLVASVDLVLVATLATYAVLRYRGVPRVVRPALASLALILVQAAVGALVVLRSLEALDVTAHLGTAMLLVGSLSYLCVASFSVEARPAGPPWRFTSFAWLVAGSVFAVILVGAYVRGSGAGLAFRDWPLMDGELVPAITSVDRGLMFAHRLLALEAGVLVAALALRAPREPAREPWTKVLALVAAGLFAAQVLFGAATVWTRLAPAAVVAHVTTSSLVLGSLVAAAAASRVCLPARRPSVTPARAAAR